MQFSSWVDGLRSCEGAHTIKSECFIASSYVTDYHHHHLFLLGITSLKQAEMSYFATDSQSVSQSVLALRLSGTRDQILAVVTQLRAGVMGRPPWRVDGAVT
jgi:hypothetical protein